MEMRSHTFEGRFRRETAPMESAEPSPLAHAEADLTEVPGSLRSPSQPVRDQTAFSRPSERPMKRRGMRNPSSARQEYNGYCSHDKFQSPWIDEVRFASILVVRDRMDIS